MTDGYFGKCKECTRRDNTLNRTKNIVYYRQYDRDRSSLEHRVLKRKQYAITHKDIVKAAKHRWALRNRHKRQANWIISNAIRDGLIVRGPCEVCGLLDAEGHHDDYSKPLAVRWLCDKHHKQHHKNQRELKRKEAL